MIARILEVCDAVAAHLQALWANPLTATARRSYRVNIQADSLVGRWAYVFPTSYGNPGAASRGEKWWDHQVSLVVVERYTGHPAGQDAWLDALVNWVEASVFSPLNDEQTLLLLGSLWPETGAVLAVYDMAELEERKLFYSVLQFTFREAR